MPKKKPAKIEGTNKYDIEQTIIALVKMAMEPYEICDIIGITLSELEEYRPVIAENFLGKREHLRKRRVRLSRMGACKNYGQIKGRLKTAIKYQIADMLMRGLDVEKLIGYDLNELIFDFESKFKEGMSWDNWGEWQIDHIKPRKEFTIEQIRECFALSNLQPLPKHENLSKGSKYNG